MIFQIQFEMARLPKHNSVYLFLAEGVIESALHSENKLRRGHIVGELRSMTCGAKLKRLQLTNKLYVVCVSLVGPRTRAATGSRDIFS